MIKQLNTSYEEILTTGGATQNKLLLQIRSDILNKKLKVINLVETVSLGAAFSGAIAAGYFSSFDEVIENLDFETEIVNPNENNTEFYDRLYQDIFVPVLEHILEINNANDTLPVIEMGKCNICNFKSNTNSFISLTNKSMISLFEKIFLKSM